MGVVANMDVFVVVTDGGALLAHSELSPGMSLNILHYTRQFFTAKNHPAENVNSVEIEKPCFR